MFERFKCPCCNLSTLNDRGMYDVCILCDWEDDGTIEENFVVGGPNGDISLGEARLNFADHLDMYPLSDLVYQFPSIHRKKLIIKNSLIELYNNVSIDAQGNKELCDKIQKFESEYRLLVELFISRLDKMYTEYKVIIDDINSNEPDNVVKGLLCLVNSCDDLEYVQRSCLIASRSDHPNIRGIAILCFGHLARIHRKITLSLVMPVVEKGLVDEDKFVRGHAVSAIDDINMFCRNDWQGDV